MKKLWLCIFLISITTSSCIEFLKATKPYWETKDEDGVYGYYYKIYLENKTDEIVVVFYYDGRRVGSIQKGKIKAFNIERGGSIYIIGRNSQRQYLSVICGRDQMTVIIQ
jgi:hypothetical protein